VELGTESKICRTSLSLRRDEITGIKRRPHGKPAEKTIREAVEQPEDQEEAKVIHMANFDAESKPGSTKSLERMLYTAWDILLEVSNETRETGDVLSEQHPNLPI
jgi:hypothetical protein